MEQVRGCSEGILATKLFLVRHSCNTTRDLVLFTAIGYIRVLKSWSLMFFNFQTELNFRLMRPKICVQVRAPSVSLYRVVKVPDVPGVNEGCWNSGPCRLDAISMARRACGMELMIDHKQAPRCSRGYLYFRFGDSGHEVVCFLRP